jgi:hypothetical protein
VILPVVAVLLVVMVPAALCLGFLAAMAIVVGALAEIEAADARLLRR